MSSSVNFLGRDVVSMSDFSRKDIEYIMDLAEKMIPYANGEKRDRPLAGKILCNLFFEPSTRTRLSFESAAYRLGLNVMDVSQISSTSMTKGETFADTIRMVDTYCDAIVLRHPHDGAARLAANVSKNPVINAGDGTGSHPTQTLLDLFTMKRSKGSIDGLNIALVGDLKYGRTVHSLSDALTKFGAKLTFVAPESLQMPDGIIEGLKKKGCDPQKTDRLDDVIEDADVLYVTRIQKERFPDPAEYQKVAGTYRIDMETLREAKKDLIIMHPLPRVDEIAPEIDNTAHAKYFEQAFNGIPVRMALLYSILGGEM